MWLNLSLCWPSAKALHTLDIKQGDGYTSCVVPKRWQLELVYLPVEGGSM
jgi:hypothetical protein